jgi:hypothetical protein
MSGYDIIGDVHGMATLLEERLKRLGYSAEYVPHTADIVAQQSSN